MKKLDLLPIGSRIRLERARLDLTQHALAALAGVQQKTIAQIERGKQSGLSVATLVGLAKALGNLSLDYLVYGKEDKTGWVCAEVQDTAE